MKLAERKPQAMSHSDFESALGEGETDEDEAEHSPQVY
jgi:hypothetical protein